LTPEISLDVARTEFEFRAQRLGVALRGLAAELVDERRKAAEMRREIAALRSQLASLTAPLCDDGAVPGPDGQRT
jgi:hypothetical protein